MLSSSVSGLQTASLQILAAGGNIANASTPGYVSRRVDLATTGAGDVGVSGVTGTGEPDLLDDFVTLIQARAAFKLNLGALKSQSETLGTVLDLIA
ncbi:MAG: hypothetical protein HUU15_03455 [Candidatus Brocadiae bacterium]|nr:hypothetical protein [Candidatus Brocadiia bacterium]